MPSWLPTRTLALAVALAACAPDEVQIVDRDVQAACGSCVFHIPRSRGCFWAVDIDGEYLPATGDVVPPVDMAVAHAPGGMCAMARTAHVSGTVSGGRFLATRFDLEPVTDPPPDAVAPPHSH